VQKSFADELLDQAEKYRASLIKDAPERKQLKISPEVVKDLLKDEVFLGKPTLP
jgi:hypothetical protein